MPKLKPHVVFTIFIIIFTISRCSLRNFKLNMGGTEYIFHKLDLIHKNSDGTKDWQLLSPEATYQEQNRLINAIRPKAIIYTSNKPSLRIVADKGVIYNNGEKINLYQNVRIRQIEPNNNYSIIGDSLYWLPKKGDWTIDNGSIVTTPKDDKGGVKSTQKIIIDGNNIRGNSILGEIELDNCKIFTAQQILKADNCSWDIIKERLLATGSVKYSR